MSKPAKELDPWCRPDGSWAVGKRMVVDIFWEGVYLRVCGLKFKRRSR